MQVEQLKNVVVEQLEDLKAKDISVLDVRELSSVTDYMVVASGTSNRHVKSVAHNLVSEMKDQGVMPLGVEGDDVSEWVLVDLGDVVVHIMLAQTRDFYQLEKLWDPNWKEARSN
ncbi:ribosome silencing factor [Kangiella spongicola]|jgi:ribosome-associated protein|uniref:Ribosomal silencing factor RsfS n=1 Tax=Kangiella spongicola TaxID=796379 RepID=A0A318D6W1_9GAMM|nr:ribosome silencing factor [Kangiella spongicola]MBV35282.1 ribosome silencing factor [Rickettsiales bacterium]PXF64553.1 ribosome silencing factor [Kangiella spongicola]